MSPKPAKKTTPHQQRCEEPSKKNPSSAFNGVRAALVAFVAAAAGFVGFTEPSFFSGVTPTSRENMKVAPTDFSGGLLEAPRRHWDPTDPGAIEELVRNSAPVVLTGLSAQQFPALDKWQCGSEDFVARVKKVGKLPVKVNRESNTFMYASPMRGSNFMSNHFSKVHFDMWTQNCLRMSRGRNDCFVTALA